MMPIDMMIRKLRLHSDLSEEDTAALRSIVSHVRELPAETCIQREGDVVSQCTVILSGFSYRSKVTDNGKRQILSFHIAGEMPDLHGLFFKTIDHDLTSLSRARVGFIDHAALQEVIDRRAAVAKALWHETLLDAARFRQWIVSLGTQSAASRLAYLIAEIRQRLAAVGLAADDQFSFPITQVRLAEALGLSTVHVNRTLQSFRAKNILDIQDRVVTLGDIEKIVELGGFGESHVGRHEDA
ncbi:Crp/Fnr family transcriptional regulator [Bradyrhizobium elkanii]|uniref:Crp/Fnr family transcriptional regulator n=1 Tax=Bradyrhizobium elkanii TaxID=29448 RepID=UPI003D2012ED